MGSSAHRRHALEFDDMGFEVDPGAGGRVTSFRLGGVDILAGPEVDPNQYGSTLWTSPQSDCGWPPPEEFDRCAYSVVAEGDAMTLTGPPIAALGVCLEKRFAIDRAKGAIAIEYTLRNIGAVQRVYSAWEVTRVHAGGLTFFPTGDRQTGPLAVERRNGMTWYAHTPETLDETGQKHSADGTQGYVAHVARGLLYVKSFVDLTPEMQAPGEGEVEVYANRRYVEVEAQGPYAPIAPGAAARWAVTWYLRKLDDLAYAAIGSSALQGQVADILQPERT
jgi:hypothetical protein